jgi:hypothetical protein
MNSLEQLNNFSSDTIDYGDEAEFSISLLNLGNQTVSATEGQDHVLPLGIVILDLVSGPTSIFYQVDLSTAPANVTVQWPTLPAGVTESTPSSRVSRLTGVSTTAIWDVIKQPTIIIPRDYSGTFSYTVTFNAGAGNVVSWTVTVTNSDSSELNTTTPTSIVYDEDVPKVFGSGNVIQITDVENPNTDFYVLTGTFSNAAGNLSSSYTTTGVTSVAGLLSLNNSKTEINNYLTGLVFVPAIDYDQSFNITWLLTNPVSNVQTTATQSVTIGNTNIEIQNMNLTRSYTENGYGLLFPTDVPQIVENVGGTYTIEFTLSADIGVIGLGENFSSPTNWSPTTKTYSFTGSRTECNNIFSTLRFFPGIGISSNATITYTQKRDGTLQGTQAFSITGTPLASYHTAPATVTVNEDSSFATSSTIYPHYSQIYGMLFQTQRSGSAVTDVGNFNLPTGFNYTSGGNASTMNGIYKNYSAAANLTVHLNNLNQVSTGATLLLDPDYATNFTLVRQFGPGTSYDGSNWAGGTVYSANAAVTVSGHAEYSATTSYNYTEDNTVQLVYQITDLDTQVTSYTVTIAQTTPVNSGLTQGRFIVDGTPQAWGTDFSFTGSKTAFNAKTIVYEVPKDFVNNITLTFNQSKVVAGVTYVQANNATMTLTCNQQHDEWNLIRSFSYAEDQSIKLIYGDLGITDQDTTPGITYTIQVNQVGPTQATNPGRFCLVTPTTQPLSNAWGAFGQDFSVTTTKENFNNLEFWYDPPTDYTSSITLSYTQIKNGQFGNVVQANAESIILNNTSSDAEYSIQTAYNYNEDQRVPLSGDITDSDQTYSSPVYTVVIRQTTPDPAVNPGRIFVGDTQGDNAWANAYQDYTFTGSAATFNGLDLLFDPPPDYTGSIVLQYNQSKVVHSTTFTQASNVNINMTCVNTNNEIQIPSSLPTGTAGGYGGAIDLINQSTAFWLDDGGPVFRATRFYRWTSTVLSGPAKFNTGGNPTVQVTDLNNQTIGGVEEFNTYAITLWSLTAGSGQIKVKVERLSPGYTVMASDIILNYTFV